MNVLPPREEGGQARVGPADGQEAPAAVGEERGGGDVKEAMADEPQELSEADERMPRFYGECQILMLI